MLAANGSEEAMVQCPAHFYDRFALSTGERMIIRDELEHDRHMLSTWACEERTHNRLRIKLTITLVERNGSEHPLHEYEYMFAADFRFNRLPLRFEGRLFGWLALLQLFQDLATPRTMNSAVEALTKQDGTQTEARTAIWPAFEMESPTFERLRLENSPTRFVFGVKGSVMPPLHSAFNDHAAEETELRLKSTLRYPAHGIREPTEGPTEITWRLKKVNGHFELDLMRWPGVASGLCIFKYHLIEEGGNHTQHSLPHGSTIMKEYKKRKQLSHRHALAQLDS